MSYLVLHIDVEFIVGVVCADNGTSHQITHGNEDLLWLYFHNNPHQNVITFGKDHKPHFNHSEVNYYGKFFESIEKDIEKFSLRGIEHPVIELLEESRLLNTCRTAFREKTLDSADLIPTLITFSSSIGDNAKQKTVDYLKKNGFQINSYTIPIAELTCYHALNQGGLKVANGSAAIFMEASNSTLHLMKLVLSDNYFLKGDGKTAAYKGKGLDPRKRALVRFIVNEVNKTTGVLSDEDEKEAEIDRLEFMADDWLRRIDVRTVKTPFRISSVSFARTPNLKRDVLVQKTDLDSDTGHYTQELKDIYESFVSDNVRGDIAAVFLLGDCFLSDRVKKGFEQMIGNERIHFYANKDIRDVLAMYPKIDINRYSSEEARIKARADAEALKQAQERALEDKQRKEAEAEAQKREKALKEEQNRKNARDLFTKAVEQAKAGNLDDAKINADNALLLDRSNREYKQFIDDLDEKISKLKARNELYKSYLNKADKFLASHELEKALDEYEAAQSVFENAEIIQKIIEVKRLIKNKKQKKETIARLLAEIPILIEQGNLLQARDKVDEILASDKENATAKSFLLQIEQLTQQQAAERKEKEKRTKYEKIVEDADRLLTEDKWEEAQQQYKNALNLYPHEKSPADKIKLCADKIKAQEDAYKGLILDAETAEKKGAFSEALRCLETALKINPNDDVVKGKIKKVQFELDFESEAVKPNSKNDDDFLGTNKKKIVVEIKPKKDFDFSEKKQKKVEPDDDNFIDKKKISPKKVNDDYDDFLRPKKKNY